MLEHKPTPASRRKVSVAAAWGMPHVEIALALNIARPTLEKHYGHELSIGASQRRMEVMQALQKQATKGNVAACKALLAITPLVAAPPAEPAPDPMPKLGKKEQAQADARTAQQGTDWDTLLPRTVQ